MMKKVNNIFTKMQNTTTHQNIMVPKFQQRFGISGNPDYRKSNILTLSNRILRELIPFHWNRGTVNLSIVVVRLR